MFKSIVVAFDGSDYANRALEIASSLAQQGQVSLGIIYVIDSSHMRIPDDMRRIGEIEHIIEPMPRLVVNFEQAPPGPVEYHGSDLVRFRKGIARVWEISGNPGRG